MSLFGKKKKRKSALETAKKKKKAKRGRTHLVIGLVLSVLIVGFLYRFATSQYFAISRIDIVNNQRVSGQRITELAGIKVGDNLLKVSSSKINKQLKTEPWINRTDVVKKLPSTLELRIVERLPIAILEAPNGRFLADRYSIAVAQANGEQLPVVRIPGIAAVVVSKRIDNPDFQVALNFIAGLSDRLRRELRDVTVDGQKKIMASTTDGVAINYGLLEDVNKKNYVLDVILSKARVDGTRLKLIDLRSVTNPVVLKAGP